MALQNVSCPECGATVKTSAPSGKTVSCPKCKHSFRVEEEEAPAPAKKPGAAIKKPGGPGKSRHREDDLEPAHSAKEKKGAKESGSNKTVPIMIGVGAVLVLAGGILLATGVFSGDDKPKQDKKVASSGSSGGTSGSAKETSATEGDIVTVAWPGKLDDESDSPKPKVEPKDPPAPPEVASDRSRQYLVFDAQGHTGAPCAALFTRDGKEAVTIAADKTVRLWDVATGQPVKVLRLPSGAGKEGVPMAAALSPSGKHLAVAGIPYGALENTPGKIHLFELSTGRMVQTFEGHTKMVTGLTFSRDGTGLASSSVDGTGIIYNLQTGRGVVRMNHLPDLAPLRGIACAADGVLLATASDDGIARVWNSKTLAIVQLKGHAGPVNCVAFNSSIGNRTLLASGGVDGTIRLWMPSGANKGIWKVTEDDGQTPVPITSLTFTRDSKELLYTGGGPNGRAGILNTETGRKREFTKHTHEVTAGALSPNGTLALTAGGADSECFLWNTKDGSLVHTLKGIGRSVWAVGLSPDGHTIAWGNTQKGDTTEGTTPLEHTFNLDKLELGPAPTVNFRRALLTLGDKTIGSVDPSTATVQDGKKSYTLKTGIKDDRVYCYTLLPRDRAVLGTAFGMYLFDLKTEDPISGRKVIREYRGQGGSVLSMAVSPNGYLITGSNDQTISIWHPGRTEPLMSLFVAGSEWVAWTPEGFYGTSANGEKLMRWLTNHGYEKLATVSPPEPYHQAMFRPQALRELWLAGGNIQMALARLSGGGRVTMAARPVPDVVITSPAEKATLTERVQVRAEATSKGEFPVTSMRLLVDGRPYGGSKSAKPILRQKLGTVSMEWSVDLMPGKHILTVQADTRVGPGRSKQLEVTRSGKYQKPDLYILATGVSAYQAINPLNFGHSDADLIAQTFRPLENTEFIGKVYVRLYKDGQATKQGIEEGLTWLAEKMEPKDIGLFTFSGHGARTPEGEFYLCPVDMALPSAPGGVTGRFVAEKLADMQGRVICMMDACHAGGAAEVKLIVADDLKNKLSGTDCGVVCMCASASYELSGEGPQTMAGFFTRAVADGMAGAADFDKDGIIYLHELDRYVRMRTQEFSNRKQNPTTGRPPELHSFPLVRVKAK
jgi:WD40 repeat protein